MSTHTSMLAAALDLAERGFPVLPLHHPIFGPDGAVMCSCQRGATCSTIGKHPRISGWQHAATTNPDQLRRWWRRWPEANIGARTGRTPTGKDTAGRAVYPASQGVLVVDIDPRHGGDETLTDLEAGHGPLPQTWRAVTGGRGAHILYTYEGAPVRNVQRSGDGIALGPGLDVRGDGGQFVAPGSVHYKTRQRYEWDAGAHPDDLPLAPAPPWLLARLRAPTFTVTVPGPGLDTAAVLAGVPEGERDTTLYRLACKLRYADVPRDWAEQLVCEAAANCKPPFPHEDALAKVAGAYQRHQPSAAVRAAVEAEMTAAMRVMRRRLRVKEVTRHA